MILRFNGQMDYVAFNTDNMRYTRSKHIVEDYDEIRHFMPHVVQLEYPGDIFDMIYELEANGYEETNESYLFYDGNDTCTEFVTDDLPFN